MVSAGDRVAGRATASGPTCAGHFGSIDPMEPSAPGFLTADIVTVVDIGGGTGECVWIVGIRKRRPAIPEPDRTKGTYGNDRGDGPESLVAQSCRRQRRPPLLPAPAVSAHQMWCSCAGPDTDTVMCLTDAHWRRREGVRFAVTTPEPDNPMPDARGSAKARDNRILAADFDSRSVDRVREGSKAFGMPAGDGAAIRRRSRRAMSANRIQVISGVKGQHLPNSGQ